MPITKSAKKALRVEKRRIKINKKVKSAFQVAVSKFKKDPTSKKLAICYSSVDKLWKKGIIHKNKAARIKSKLAHYLKSRKSAKKHTKNPIKN